MRRTLLLTLTATALVATSWTFGPAQERKKEALRTLVLYTPGVT